MNAPVLKSRASFAKRFIAMIIDFVLVPPVALVIMLATGVMESAEAYVMPQPIIRISGLVFVSFLLLNGYLLLRRRQTIGKRLLKITFPSEDTRERLAP